MLKYFNSQASGGGLSRDFIKNQALTGFFHSIFALGGQIFYDSSTGEPAAPITLVELVGNDSVLDQKLEGNDLEGVLMSGLEDDRAGGSRLLDLQPARGADAPAIAGFETGETELGHRGAEVVAQGL